MFVKWERFTAFLLNDSIFHVIEVYVVDGDKVKFCIGGAERRLEDEALTASVNLSDFPCLTSFGCLDDQEYFA